MGRNRFDQYPHPSFPWIKMAENLQSIQCHFVMENVKLVRMPLSSIQWHFSDDMP